MTISGRWVVTAISGGKTSWLSPKKSQKEIPSKGKKGKGNYLTSVAKQAKTAFLHGPTV